jgi:hypothetical protein
LASTWDWIKLNILQAFSAGMPGNAQAVSAGTAATIIRETEPDIPPTIGEMAEHGVEAVGRLAAKIFTPFLWIAGILIALFILWAFIGRKS